jgi:glucan phosphoethanolaminetransferase (alkaline phosphatase superfamily)
MEKRSLENEKTKQEQYNRATQDLLKMFTKFFLAAFFTVLTLASGIYLYNLNKQIIGFVLMIISIVALHISFYFSFKIHSYIKKHKQ